MHNHHHAHSKIFPMLYLILAPFDFAVFWVVALVGGLLASLTGSNVKVGLNGVHDRRGCMIAGVFEKLLHLDTSGGFAQRKFARDPGGGQRHFRFDR